MSAANQQQETLPQFTLCRDTGALAVGGTCPTHGGDACLFEFIRLVDSRARLAAAETARDEAIARATRFYETATRAVTSRHAAETALREIAHYEEPWPQDPSDVYEHFQTVARAALASPDAAVPSKRGSLAEQFPDVRAFRSEPDAAAEEGT